MIKIAPSAEKSNVSPNKKITLLTSLILPLLIVAGCWQLQRAAEKRDTEQRWQIQQQQPIVVLNGNNILQLPDYQRVMSNGNFSPVHQWYLDNRHRQGKYGFEILQEFVLDDGTRLLVNRGWVAAGSERQHLPTVVTPAEQQTVFGELMTLQPYALLENIPASDSWPQVILHPDITRIRQQLDHPLSSRYLRLDNTSESALITNWQQAAMSSTRHTGYAVQWFAMAIALILWFVIANTTLPEKLRAQMKNRNTRS